MTWRSLDERPPGPAVCRLIAGFRQVSIGLRPLDGHIVTDIIFVGGAAFYGSVGVHHRSRLTNVAGAGPSRTTPGKAYRRRVLLAQSHDSAIFFCQWCVVSPGWISPAISPLAEWFRGLLPPVRCVIPRGCDARHRRRTV